MDSELSPYKKKRSRHLDYLYLHLLNLDGAASTMTVLQIASPDDPMMDVFNAGDGEQIAITLK